MNAREKILNKIRKAHNPATAATTQTMTAHLTLHPRGPLPPPAADLLARFKERALKLSSDIIETGDIKEIPALLAEYLHEQSLPLSGVCWPVLAALPWNEAGLEIQQRPARVQARPPLLGPSLRSPACVCCWGFSPLQSRRTPCG